MGQTSSLIRSPEEMMIAQRIIQMYPYLEHLGEPLTIVDLRIPGQPLVFVNDTFVKMTLYPRSEILGRNCRFLQGRFTNRETVAKMRKAIEDGVALDVELLNYRKDGIPFWNNCLLLPFWEDAQMCGKAKPTHFLGVQKDVTFIRPELKDPLTWSPEEVAIFLETLSLDSMAELAFSGQIDGASFLQMSSQQMEQAGIHPTDCHIVQHLIAQIKNDPDYAPKLMMDFRFADKIITENPNTTLPPPSYPSLAQQQSLHYSGPSAVVNVSAPRNLEVWRVGDGGDQRAKQVQSGDVALNVIVTNPKRTFKIDEVILLKRDFEFEDLSLAIKYMLDTNFLYTIYYVSEIQGPLTIENTNQLTHAKALSNDWHGNVVFEVVVNVSRASKLKSKKKTRRGRHVDSAAAGEEGGAAVGGKQMEDQYILDPVSSNMLEEILSNPPQTVIFLDLTFAKKNHVIIFESILNWYKMNHRIFTIITACLESLISGCHDRTLLFRKDTGSFNFLSLYANQLCNVFRFALLNPILTEYLSRPGGRRDICAKIIASLISAIDEMPSEFRQLVSVMARITASKFPKDRYRGVAKLLFAHLICPAITTPNEHGMTLPVVMDAEKEKMLFKLATKLQNYVTSFLNDSKTSLTLELAILFSRLSNAWEEKYQSNQILRSICSNVTHHDLIAVKAHYDRKAYSYQDNSS